MCVCVCVCVDRFTNKSTLYSCLYFIMNNTNVTSEDDQLKD